MAAAWIGTFDSKDDDEVANNKKQERRNITFVGSSTVCFRLFLVPHFPSFLCPQDPRPKKTKYANNEVHTSKYNVATFVPKIIYLQFSRLANLYTLCIVVLCMFSFSPVGPLSSLTPLLVVFGVSTVKELIEDIQLHFYITVLVVDIPRY